MTAPPNRYLTLDAMRGIAALIVAAYHFRLPYGAGWFPGHLAVDLFFALSGFVIALNYTERFRDGLTFARFAEMRIVRLYPLYAFGLVLGIALQVGALAMGDGRGMAPPSLACHVVFGAAMLPSPCSTLPFPLNDPAWSLFAELLVNLAFALVLWRLRTAGIAIVALAAALVLGALIGPPDHFNVGWERANFPAGIVRAVFSFCVGMLVFRVIGRRPARPSSLALLPLILLPLVLSSATIGLTTNRQFVAVVAILPILLLLGVVFDMPGRLRRIAIILGDLSYPVYAIHFPLVALATRVARGLRLDPLPATIAFLASVTSLGLVASVADDRVRRLVGARLRLRRSAPAHFTA